LLYAYKCRGSCRLCLDGNAYGDGDRDEKRNGDTGDRGKILRGISWEKEI
jgi:hypothetical protein